MASQEIIDPFEFFQYDKISDDVYTIGFNTVLRFNVSLSYKNSNTKERYSFHREYEYQSKTSNMNLVTVRRTFDYFLSIENNQKPENCDKCFIRIGASEYILLRQALSEAISWFRDEKYSKLFMIVKNKLVVMKPVPEYVIDKLPMGKYIKIEPTILEYGEEQEPGVIMYLSSPNNFVLLPLDKLMGFYYTITSFNMFQSAQLMLNYLQRPQYGFNCTSFTEGRSLPSNGGEESTSSIIGRKVKSKALPETIK